MIIYCNKKRKEKKKCPIRPIHLTEQIERLIIYLYLTELYCHITKCTTIAPIHCATLQVKIIFTNRIQHMEWLAQVLRDIYLVETNYKEEYDDGF
jgi:hypothetical protein